MPNYDLGTARGRVKIDSDTRGLKGADRALDAFSRTIRAISGRLGGFEATMNRMEAELRDAEREFNQADRAAGRFDRTIDGVSRRTKTFNVDVLELSNRMRGLYNTAERVTPSLLLMTRALREFRGTNGGILGLFQTIQRSGGVGTVLALLTSRFIGMGRALDSVTGRQRQLVQFAGTFRTFSFLGGIVAAAAAKMGLFERVTGRLVRNTIEGDHALLGMRNTLERFSRPIGNVIRNLDRMALGTVQLVGGMALMRSGLRGLTTRFGGFLGLLRGMPGWVKAAVAATVIFSEAIAQLGARILVATSNLILDLVAAVKQLSGGFLAIPGGIAMAVAAIGTLKAIISPMKDQFKDLLKAIGEGGDVGAAIAALPEQLRPLGQVLADIIPKWKALQMALQATFVGGADQQLRALSDTYLPAISRGSLMVANSWRVAKDQLVAFLAQRQTVSDVQRIFMNTAQTMNNFKDSLLPAGEGMRDLAAVGSDFLRALSAGLPNLVQQFANWAAINRENGNLMRWMTDAWRGTKQLVDGLVNAGKAAFTLITLFANRSGAGALERFANAMERFNNAVQSSAAGGVLRQIGDAVRSMGTDKIRELWDILKLLAGALKDVLPLVNDIATGFRDVMVPAIQLAVGIIRAIADTLNQFGGGRVIGWILGLVGAWKLLGTVLGPIRNVIQILIGAFTGFKGAQNLVLGLAGSLENFGGIGRRAAGGILSIGDSLAKWGTLGLAAAAGIAVAWEAYSQGAADISKANKDIADSTKQAAQFTDDLNKAFRADKGMAGGTVFDTVVERVQTMRDSLATVAGDAPGMMARFNDQIGNLFETGKGIGEQWSQLFGDSSEIKGLDDAAHKADLASKAFDRLGISNENLAAAATGSESVFQNLQETLRNSGEGGNEAADQLQKLHNTYVEMQRDFAAAGPGAAQLAEGIRQIANAGGDADTKLTGMKLALQGLGLDKTTQYENAIALAEAVNKIATEASTAADQSQPLTDIWGPNGELNAGFSANANNLFNLLSPAIEQFKRTAASGGDISAAFQRITDQIPALAQAFTPVGGNVADTTAKIQGLIGELGGIPQIVSILVQLDGKDKVTQDLGQIYLWAQQNIGKGINVPILVQDPKAVETEIEKIFGDIATSDQSSIKFKFNVDPGALAQLGQILASHGVQMPGGPAPAAPATVPVAPGAPAPGAPPPPPVKVNVDQTEIDKYKQTIGDLQKQVNDLNSKPAKIQIDVGTLDEIKSKIKELQSVLHDGKLEFTIVAKGYDETTAVLNQVKGAVTGLIDEVNKIPAAFQNAMNGAGAALTGFSATLINSGLKMMQDLASGITGGTAQFVIPAVDRMIQEIKDRTPSSPPKKGPLAGQNYVDNSGLKLASDFAGGIISGYPIAGKAGDGLAAAVGAALPYSSGSFQKDTGFLSQFSRILEFAQQALGVMRQVSDTMFGALKFASDPLGKGGFFGQSTGTAFGFRRDPGVSADDLRRKREDANYQAIGTRQEGTGKAPGPTEVTGEVTVAGADWDAIAKLESGGRWNLPSGDRDSTGGLQIRQGTWEAFGGLDIAPQPYLASKEGQIAIAEKILAKQGPQAWAGGKNFVPAKLGQTITKGITKGVTAALRPDLKVTGRQGLKPAAENLLEVIAAQFPEVATIGGKRADAKPDHPAGRALDIMIGKNLELGDQINKFLRDNATALGIHSTIWRDTWQDLEGNSSKVAGHMDHIHARVVETADGFNNALIGTTPTGIDAKGAQDTQDDILTELRRQTPILDDAVRVGQDPNATDQQVATALSTIQQQIDAANTNDTPAGRAQLQALDSVKSSIMADRGMQEGANPIEQASQFASNAMNVASDILGVLQAGIEAWAAAKNLTDIGIRYPANTEDIMGMIDDFQKFIDLAAKVFQAVGDISGMGAGADPSGITAGISAIAGLIAGALQAVNAGIDLAQEAYHIWGSYFGQFLGILAGGPGGALQGNVRFLLDENAGQLYAYGQDNPQDKRGHNVPGMIHQPDFQQARNNINVYGGPGSDPRDNTRQMMFQIKASEMTGATGQ